MSTELTLRNPDLEPCNWCHFRIIPLCCQVLKQHPSSLILDAHLYPFIVIIQSLSRIWLFATPWTVARQAPLSSTISQNLFKIMSIESVMLSNHFILWWNPSSSALNLSQHQGLFQWVSSSHQVTKVLEFQLQHQSFQWIFRTDFL